MGADSGGMWVVHYGGGAGVQKAVNVGLREESVLEWERAVCDEDMRGGGAGKVE